MLCGSYQTLGGLAELELHWSLLMLMEIEIKHALMWMSLRLIQMIVIIGHSNVVVRHKPF